MRLFSLQHESGAKIIVAALAVATLSSCGQGMMVDSMSAASLEGPSANDAGNASRERWAARKLIRTGTLRMEVDDFADASEEVARIAETSGGFLANSNVSLDGKGKRSGVLTVRVPSERFSSAFEELKAIGEVERESMDTQDVTKEYTDLETRLGVKQGTRARLQEILASGTGKVSEVLEVERELSRVVEEIERLKGEIRYYDQQAALSTISVELYEPEAVIREGATSLIRDAFRDSLGVLVQSVAVLVYMITFVLPWLVIAALVWWIVQAIMARRRKPATDVAD